MCGDDSNAFLVAGLSDFNDKKVPTEFPYRPTSTQSLPKEGPVLLTSREGFRHFDVFLVVGLTDSTGQKVSANNNFSKRNVSCISIRLSIGIFDILNFFRKCTGNNVRHFSVLALAIDHRNFCPHIMLDQY